MQKSISWKETFTLWWIALKVFWKRVIEGITICLFYYSRSWSFLKQDLALLAAYWKKSPYQISNDYWESQSSSDTEIYGETPLTTMDLISTACGIGPEDCVFELGSGRGRTCFWLRRFVGCRVVGIECIPEFIQRAEAIQKRFGIDSLEFRQTDFLETSYTGATLIYLYGTTMNESSIKRLINLIHALPLGTRIISVSYPLEDYCDEKLFEIERVIKAPFLWGDAEVFLQRKCLLGNMYKCCY